MRRALLLVACAHAGSAPPPRHVMERKVIDVIQPTEVADLPPADLPTVACEDHPFAPPIPEDDVQSDDGYLWATVGPFHAGCASSSFLTAHLAHDEPELRGCFDSSGADDGEVTARASWSAPGRVTVAFVDADEPDALAPCLANVLATIELDVDGQPAQVPLVVDLALERGHGDASGVLGPPP